MIDPVTAETLLGGGLAVTLAALTAQWRAKRAAQRGEEEARRREQNARAELARRQQAFETERRSLGEQADQARRWYQAAEEEIRHLVMMRLPAVVDAAARRYPGVVVPGLLHEAFEDTVVGKYHRVAEDLVREAVEAARDGVGAAARAGVRGMADETQTYLARLQRLIDEELDQHPGAGAYHQSLVNIDRVVTQALHTVQRLRILAGSWPGLQRANCTLREIVESARGRIAPFQRVLYTYRPDVGEQFVEGRVVEPIAVALAELLGNATAYSSGPVTVYALRVQAGFCVVVEDSGLGMNAFQRATAEELLGGGAVMDVTALGDEHRLGFAVVGRLARDYGFGVDVSAPSSTGGVKAVLLIPTHLMADGPSESPVPAYVPPATAELAPAPAAPAPDPAPGLTTGGLPKRQRRAYTMTEPPPTQETVLDTADPIAVATGFTQMRQALIDGYATTSAGDDDA